MVAFAVLRALSLMLALAAGFPARADEPVAASALPTDEGVLVEAHTVIDAPAALAAKVAGDPQRFVELLPAETVQPLGGNGAGEAARLRVRMKAPWPIRIAEWTEVVRQRSDGDSLIVEREAIDRDFYKHMRARWRITPLGQARCEVVYRVSLDLTRWPAWMVRSGSVTGVGATVRRLQQMTMRELLRQRDESPR